MNNCNCKLQSCITCQTSELEKTKRKLAKYEQAVKFLIDESISEPDTHHPINLYESIIITKNNEGQIEKKHTSDLGESYLIIDKAKNINQLDNKERQSISEQDNYRNYQIARHYANKSTYYYGMLGVVTKVAGFFIGLF